MATVRAVWTCLAISQFERRLARGCFIPCRALSVSVGARKPFRTYDPLAYFILYCIPREAWFFRNKMDRSQCVKLIELYGKYYRLWDSHDQDYYNKRLREDAWRKISVEMSIPVGKLKKKMESLLGSYRREKSRMKKSRISGTDIYTSSWYAYEHFHFARDRNKPEKKVDTMQVTETELAEIKQETHESETELGEGEAENDSEIQKEEQETQTQLPRKRKRKRATTTQQEVTDERVSEAFQLLKQCASHDSYNTYGEYIANELRKYDPITLAHVKHAISTILFEADTGKYEQINTEY